LDNFLLIPTYQADVEPKLAKLFAKPNPYRIINSRNENPTTFAIPVNIILLRQYDFEKTP
jgi:hypothetical protein